MAPTTRAYRNDILEGFIRYFKIPCQNQQKGCDFVSPLDAANEHRNKCRFGFCCPFFNKCKKHIQKPDFQEHLFNDHKMEIKQFSENWFEVPDLKPDQEGYHLLIQMKRELFLFNVRRIPKKQALVSLYDTEDKNDKAFKFFIECNNKAKSYVGTLGSLTDYQMGCTTKSVKFNAKYCKNIKIEMNFSQAFWANCITEENEFKSPECPICKEDMNAPIHLCKAGHSICNTCRLKLTKCPICQADYTGSRNYTMETMIEEMFRPRKQRKLEEKKYLKCLIPQCPMVGTLADVTEHVKNFHRAEIMNDRRYKFNTDQLDFAVDTVKVKVLQCYNRLFRIALYYDLDHNKVMIAVNVLAEKDEKLGFDFTCYCYHVKGVQGIAIKAFSTEEPPVYHAVSVKSKQGVCLINNFKDQASSAAAK